MARTIAEIKQEMTSNYITDPNIKLKYGLQDGLTFEDQFSMTSIESIWFYIVASAIWTLEKLFDVHKKEVETEISNKKPHRLKWYRDKTLAFQKDYSLPVNSDIYEKIDSDAMVVKYAAAVEPPDSSILLIKIAGDKNGLRSKLDDPVATQVYNYLQWIKDAGVRINLVNKDADMFKCEVTIHYNGMLLSDIVKSNVRAAINNYIENLDFNGEFSNMALVDKLQIVEGVMIVGEINCSSKPNSDEYNFSVISDKRIPDAGYLRAYKETDIIINMIPYELVSD